MMKMILEMKLKQFYRNQIIIKIKYLKLHLLSSFLIKFTKIIFDEIRFST
jgi:hypothetical protein